MIEAALINYEIFNVVFMSINLDKLVILLKQRGSCCLQQVFSRSPVDWVYLPPAFGCNDSLIRENRLLNYDRKSTLNTRYSNGLNWINTASVETSSYFCNPFRILTKTRINLELLSILQVSNSPPGRSMHRCMD